MTDSVPTPPAPQQFVSRQDLRITRQRLGNQWQWVVEDPIRDRFFRFGESEIAMIHALRTPQSIEHLSSLMQTRLRLRLSEFELKAFLLRLVNDNLVSVVQMGEGNRYWRQSQKLSAAKWKQSLFGLLAIKLPGINPGPVLRNLNWMGWLLFHPVTIFLVFAFLLGTVGFATLSFDSFLARVPSPRLLLSPTHIGLFFVAFCCVKLLHELAHGLACNRYGGHCREMGILFLVFMPCLYCDVSDMWNQPSKWKRIMVSVAGIYVELAIAVICFWGWYFSNPGLVSALMFSVCLLGSLNTLFVNGNPLLKYDGYFVLSDLTNSPNLAQDSKSQLQSRIQSFLFRVPNSDQAGVVGWQLGYAVAAIVYRFLILTVILTIIYKFFDYLELTSFGVLFVGLVSATILIPMLKAMISTTQSEYPRRWGSWAFTLGIVLMLLLAVFTVGIRKRVFTPADIQVANAEFVYASEAGRVISLVRPGEPVSTGQLIARLENDELRLKYVELQGQLDEARQRLSGQKIKISLGAQSDGELEYLEKHVQNLKNDLVQLETQIDSLEIFAGQDGHVVVSGLSQTAELKSRDRNSVLSHSSFNPSVLKGDVLCLIGDPTQLYGFAKIEQAQVNYVKVGQLVSVFVPHATERCEGKIIRIAQVGESIQPDQNVATDSSSDDRTFLVTFSIDRPSTAIQHGFKAKAVIIGETMTIAEHCLDLFHRTFRL